MSILPKLATSLNRRDEAPNHELALQIAETGDQSAVKELVENLHNKSKHLQNDCIKVIYETGKINPKLIAEYTPQLVALLQNKNNRLQWGAMMALHIITPEKPGVINAALPNIIEAADNGSVITNDHCVGILISLCAIKKYEQATFALLNERLLKSPANQLPMYAENAFPVIGKNNKEVFLKTLQLRLPGIEKDSKRIRVDKVISKLKTI